MIQKAEPVDGLVKLRNVSEAIVDCEHKTAPTETVGIPSIRTTDIKNGRIDLQNANKVSRETYREWTKRLEPRPGDLILSREAPVGEVGIVPEGAKVCLGQRTVLIRPDREKAVPRYLLYLLLTREMRHEMTCRAEGSIVPHLNMSDIRDLEILALPSLAEQRQIAHILGTLDEKIELNRQMNETLEAIARAIFKSWFVDFDPVRAKMEGRLPAGMDTATATLFPSAFQDSPLGKIPEGWKIGTLGEIAENVRQSVKASEIDPDELYIGLEHIPRRSIALSEWQTADELGSNKYRFRKGEILFGKLRPYFHKVGVAPIEGICSTDILVVQPIDSEWFGIVLGFVSSDEFIAYTNAYSAGTRMPRTNWKDMSRYEIALPQVEVSQKYTEFIRPLIERIIENIYQSHTLSQIRDVLLPKLLSGEIRVADVDKRLEEKDGGTP
jgi:type I restriction enzyme S subunit